MADLRETFMTPEQRADTAAARQYEQVGALQSDFRNRAKELLQAELMLQKDLTPIAAKQAVAQLPGASRDEIKALALKLRDDMAKSLTGKIAAKQTALKQAVEEGAGAGYLDIFGAPDQQAAIKEGRSWKRLPNQAMLDLAREAPPSRTASILYGQFSPEEQARYNELLAEEMHGAPGKGWTDEATRILSTGGRVGAALGAEALNYGRKIAPVQQIEEAGPIADMAGKVGSVLYGAASGQLPSMIGEAVGGETGRQWGAILDNPLTKLNNLLSGGDAGRALAEGIPAALATGNVGGVDVPEALSQIAQSPLEHLGKSQLRAAGRGAKALAGHSDDATSAFQEMRRIQQHYREVAAKQAIAELPGASREEIKARATQLYETALNSDALNKFIRDPNLAQLTGEMAFDPMNALPVEKVTGAIGKQLGRVGGAAGRVAAEAFPSAAEWLAKKRDLVTYMPGAKALERLGDKPSIMGAKGTAADAAASMRMASDEGFQVQAGIHNASAADLQALAGIDKATREEWLYPILTKKRAISPEEIEKLPENMKKALEAGRRFQTSLLKPKVETGAGTAWGADDELLTAEDVAVEGFVPRRVLSEKGKAALKNRTLKEALEWTDTPLAQSKLQTRSMMERQAPEDWFSKDPLEQFAAEVEQTAREGRAAFTMKRTAEYLQDQGWMVKLDRGGNKIMVGDKVTDIPAADAAPALQHATGVEWERLDAGLGDIVQRVTGKKGALKGAEQYMVPKPVAEHFRQLAPIVGGTEKPVHQFVQTWQEINRGVYKPFLTAARAGSTVLGGVAYQLTNLAGAVGLGQVALGAKILNPKLQNAAISGALLSAGFGDEASRAMKIALRNGEEKTLGEVIDIAKRLGLLDQFEEVAGLSRGFGRGPLAKASEKFTGLGDVLGPAYVPVGALPWAAGKAVGSKKLAKFGADLNRKLSARNLSRLSENYQHLVVFMGALEGTDTKSLARALDFTSEFAGNYRRLGDAEKFFLRDTFMFYSWNRFILPHIAKQIVKNPQRFAPWAKARGYFEREGDQQVPFDRRTMHTWVEGKGFPAPAQWQPEHKEGEGFAKKHGYAVMTLEDPLSMWLGMMAPIVSVRKGEIANMLAVGPKMGLEMLTGLDSKTGEVLAVPAPFDPADLVDEMGWERIYGKARANALARVMFLPTARMERNLWNIYKLFESKMPAESLSLAMRYKARRDFGLFADVLDALTGDRGLPLGSMVPGVNVSYNQGLRAASQRQKEGQERQRSVNYQMEAASR